MESRRTKADGSSGLPPQSQFEGESSSSSAAWTVSARKGKGKGHPGLQQPKTPPDYADAVPAARSKTPYVAPIPKAPPVREASKSRSPVRSEHLQAYQEPTWQDQGWNNSGWSSSDWSDSGWTDYSVAPVLASSHDDLASSPDARASGWPPADDERSAPKKPLIADGPRPADIVESPSRQSKRRKEERTDWTDERTDWTDDTRKDEPCHKTHMWQVDNKSHKAKADAPPVWLTYDPNLQE